MQTSNFNLSPVAKQFEVSTQNRPSFDSWPLKDELENYLPLATKVYSTADYTPNLEQINRPQENITAADYSQIKTAISPKSIEESLFDASANAKLFTSTVSMHLNDSFCKKIFKQVDIIHQLDDWDEDDTPLNPESYKSFIRWVISNKSLSIKVPSFGLSHSGNLLCAWFDSENKIFIEFLERDRAKWVITLEVEEGSESANGETYTTRLVDSLKAYRFDTLGLQDQEPLQHGSAK